MIYDSDLPYWYGRGNTIPKSLDRGLELDFYFPRPTRRDYEDGTLMRYFARPVAHRSGEIMEIAPSAYSRLLNNSLWAVVEVPWRITGKIDDVLGPQNVNTPTRTYTGVKTSNRLALEAADEVISGMKNQITDLLQFYKESP